ncbi:hypothetical protein J6A31_05680 [bacterium]|nr:hypothetical protein [bacterium]
MTFRMYLKQMLFGILTVIVITAVLLTCVYLKSVFDKPDYREYLNDPVAISNNLGVLSSGTAVQLDDCIVTPLGVSMNGNGILRVSFASDATNVNDVKFVARSEAFDEVEAYSVKSADCDFYYYADFDVKFNKDTWNRDCEVVVSENGSSSVVYDMGDVMFLEF